MGKQEQKSFEMNGRAEYFRDLRSSTRSAARLALQAAGVELDAEDSAAYRVFDDVLNVIYKMGVHDGYEKGYRAGICDWESYQGRCVTTQLQSDLLDALDDFREGQAKGDRDDARWLDDLYSMSAVMAGEFDGIDSIGELSRQWRTPLVETVQFCETALLLLEYPSSMQQDEIIDELERAVKRQWGRGDIWVRYQDIAEMLG